MATIKQIPFWVPLWLNNRLAITFTIRGLRPNFVITRHRKFKIKLPLLPCAFVNGFLEVCIMPSCPVIVTDLELLDSSQPSPCIPLTLTFLPSVNSVPLLGDVISDFTIISSMILKSLFSTFSPGAIGCLGT